MNLPLGSPRTNTFSSLSRGFEPGSSVFKSPALTTEKKGQAEENMITCGHQDLRVTIYPHGRFDMESECVLEGCEKPCSVGLQIVDRQCK